MSLPTSGGSKSSLPGAASLSLCFNPHMAIDSLYPPLSSPLLRRTAVTVFRAVDEKCHPRVSKQGMLPPSSHRPLQPPPTVDPVRGFRVERSRRLALDG